jgi:PAS domain S-box-containing protein
MPDNLSDYGFLKELSSKLLDAMPVSIIITDPRGRILKVNKSFTEFTNKDGRDMIGRSLLTTREIKSAILTKKYRALIKTQKPFYNQTFRHYAEQQDRWYTMILSAVPLTSGKGKLLGILSMARDVTDLQETQNQLKLANKKLLHKITAASSRLTSAERRLKKSLLLRNQFFADASHELRTPLTIIKGNLDLLKLRHNSQPVPQYMRPELFNIEQEVGRVSQLLDDITFLNQADNAISYRDDFKNVDLRELTETVSREFKILAKAKKIELTIKLRAAEVFGNEAKLKRLITNLIGNALRYTNAGGKIKVELFRQGKKTVLSVADTGIGIGKQFLPHIFERFYRADKVRSRQSGGSGLGLAICKEIVKHHGGTISVKSTLGKGTEFSVKLNLIK